MRSTQWRSHSFWYRFGFTSSYVFCLLICEHSWSQTFRSPLLSQFLSQRRKGGCFQDNLTHRNFQTATKDPQQILLRIPAKDGVSSKQKILPSFEFRSGFAARMKANTWNTWNHTVPLVFLLHTSLSTTLSTLYRCWKLNVKKRKHN